MRVLGLSLAFVSWIVVYTTFSIWLTTVFSRHEHLAACASATSSRNGAPAAQRNRPANELAKSTNR